MPLGDPERFTTPRPSGFSAALAGSDRVNRGQVGRIFGAVSDEAAAALLDQVAVDLVEVGGIPVVTHLDGALFTAAGAGTVVNTVQVPANASWRVLAASAYLVDNLGAQLPTSVLAIGARAVRSAPRDGGFGVLSALGAQDAAADCEFEQWRLTGAAGAPVVSTIVARPNVVLHAGDFLTFTVDYIAANDVLHTAWIYHAMPLFARPPD